MATVSDRRIIDSSFTLAPGDSLQLTEAGSITEVTSAAAVVGMGGNSLTIDGDIMAGFSTGILLLAGSNTVHFSDTGSVFGKLAISANAPVTLFNDGQIIGTDQGTTYGVFLASSGSSVFN
jgi:hypothetical protein